MKKYIEYVFLIIGFAIIVISSTDVISIIVSLLENILDIRLNVVFLSSFLIRAILMLIGVAFLFIGGIMLKKRKVND